jgi:lambda repressor-like predicted transcriptional regulator
MDREHVERLRALVQRDVEGSSLRAVARAVGLSPTGLKKFIRGTWPYAPTYRKLSAWELRRQPGGREREVDAALDVLLMRVYPERKADLRRTFRQMLTENEPPPSPRAPPQRTAGIGPTFFCRWCNRDFPVVEEAKHQRMHREEEI